MPRSGKSPRLPKPHTILNGPRGTLRFYLGDCLDVLAQLPEGAVSAVVTSPPYNLGVQYRSYDDSLPRAHYLDWTGEWVQAARHALSEDGSLFLNVGAKPTDPWTFAAVIVVTGAVAVAASVGPARRAGRTDPAKVLGSS